MLPTPINLSSSISIQAKLSFYRYRWCLLQRQQSWFHKNIWIWMLLNLPSIRKFVELLSKLHILCQTEDSWCSQRPPCIFSCNFCTSIIETLMAISKSCISWVWTIWFPWFFLGGRGGGEGKKKQEDRHDHKRKIKPFFTIPRKLHSANFR